MASFLLLQTGGFLLLQTGGKLELQGSAPTPTPTATASTAPLMATDFAHGAALITADTYAAPYTPPAYHETHDLALTFGVGAVLFAAADRERDARARLGCVVRGSAVVSRERDASARLTAGIQGRAELRHVPANDDAEVEMIIKMLDRR